MNHYSDHITHFQLAKMFIVVLIVFGLCWLPYHAYFFYTYYHVVTNKHHQYPITHVYVSPALSTACKHSAHLPCLLLAGHGQLRHQPSHLLPDERQVGFCWATFHRTGLLIRFRHYLKTIPTSVVRHFSRFYRSSKVVSFLVPPPPFSNGKILTTYVKFYVMHQKQKFAGSRSSSYEINHHWSAPPPPPPR